MNVGVREFKSKLSEYLGRAVAGEAITITDRGRPVARLVALEEGSAIDRGIEQGWIEPPRRARLETVDRVSASVGVLDVLEQDRG